MKKNKIFLAAGTFALAIAGFAIAKANSKKFTSATSAYYKPSISVICTLFKGATSTSLTTVITAGKTFFVKCGTSANHTVFAVRNLSILSKTVFCKCG